MWDIFGPFIPVEQKKQILSDFLVLPTPLTDNPLEEEKKEEKEEEEEHTTYDHDPDTNLDSPPADACPADDCADDCAHSDDDEEEEPLTRWYPTQLFQEHYHGLKRRIHRLFPDYSIELNTISYLNFIGVDQHSYTAYTQRQLLVGPSIDEKFSLGILCMIIWMNDTELKELITTRVAQGLERRLLKQQTDPLYALYCRLKRLGYSHFWRLSPCTSYLDSYTPDDMLLYIYCPTLRTTERYVLIGSWNEIANMDDDRLDKHIQWKHDNMKRKFN